MTKQEKSALTLLLIALSIQPQSTGVAWAKGLSCLFAWLCFVYGK